MNMRDQIKAPVFIEITRGESIPESPAVCVSGQEPFGIIGQCVRRFDPQTLRAFGKVRQG
jgi:hypothetical protein